MSDRYVGWDQNPQAAHESRVETLREMVKDPKLHDFLVGMEKGACHPPGLSQPPAFDRLSVENCDDIQAVLRERPTVPDARSPEAGRKK